MASLAALCWLQVNRNTLNIPLLLHPDGGTLDLGKAKGQGMAGSRVRKALSSLLSQGWGLSVLSCRGGDADGDRRGGNAFLAQEKP